MTQKLADKVPSLQDYVGQIITFTFNPSTGEMEANI